MKKRFLLFIVLFTVSFSSNAQTGWLSHTDTAYNFSFKYPAAWKLKLPGTNTRFFVTSPAENDEDDFRENINAIVREFSLSELPVAKSLKEIREALSKNLTDFKEIKNTAFKWQGKNALEIEYTCTKESEGKNYYLYILQRLVVINYKMFTVTFTCIANKKDKYLPVAKQVIKSMVIK
jgi:hypothetical protein